jgi:hypothetical protein
MEEVNAISEDGAMGDFKIFCSLGEEGHRGKDEVKKRYL